MRSGHTPTAAHHSAPMSTAPTVEELPPAPQPALGSPPTGLPAWGGTPPPPCHVGQWGAAKCAKWQSPLRAPPLFRANHPVTRTPHPSTTIFPRTPSHGASNDMRGCAVARNVLVWQLAECMRTWGPIPWQHHVAVSAPRRATCHSTRHRMASRMMGRASCHVHGIMVSQQPWGGRNRKFFPVFPTSHPCIVPCRAPRPYKNARRGMGNFIHASHAPNTHRTHALQPETW